MNITAIIQARMGSTRLPGKVMNKLGDQTVLGHVINRVLAIPTLNQVIVATTTETEDDHICQEASHYGVNYFRGSRANVLSRYYEAAKEVKADVVVRITSDCPLLDPLISDKVITHFLDNDLDYSSSGLSGTFARGLDTEVFTFDALSRSYFHATKEYEYEHVTPYIYQHPDLFHIHAYSSSTDFSRYRLTLDTPEDWELISRIYGELYTGNIFHWNEILSLLERQPELALINAEVKQKKLGE
ncbi:acylneuraminate cytidylyltransferase [Paenibacillus kribbensis]|uniref:Acylneuraminate cytidylyltransferase n=1 Tax=Paenibacillus kribbensis TaxID=172713 RepID=A0A222WGW5_9BACL|nr:glycosyltransferase family protein [Paenibacillus kribbensis]ASR45619.1 acylneuraminate cytidylyltransferase [Paenibacillus kribbensis]